MFKLLKTLIREYVLLVRAKRRAIECGLPPEHLEVREVDQDGSTSDQ